MMKNSVMQLQDLGERSPTIRGDSEVGPNGVARLIPDDDKSHIAALEDIRETIEQHYGDRIDSLVNDEQAICIDRVVLRADDLPHIEYTLVAEREE
mgnify:CR=1 FL=1